MWEAFLYLWRFHSTQISSYRTFFLPRSMLASFKSMSHCTLNWITIRVFSSRTSTTSTPILSSRRILCKWSSLETWSMMFRSSLATISTRVWWMRSNFRKTNHFWRNCTIGGMMNWARFTLLLGSIFNCTRYCHFFLSELRRTGYSKALYLLWEVILDFWLIWDI